MKRTETNGNVNISFNSIADVVNYIDTTERTLFYQKYHASDSNNYSFTGTHSIDEARELLFHGWEAGIDINTLLEIAVFKGLGADTINTFNKYTLGSNKYMKVFREEFKVA